MTNRIINETNVKNPTIKKISKTKYRVLLGPFNDIKKLEKIFNEIKSLNFENIEILKMFKKLFLIIFTTFFLVEFASANFDLKARTAILQDYYSGEILYEKEA